jgi:hypothetical protein
MIQSLTLLPSSPSLYLRIFLFEIEKDWSVFPYPEWISVSGEILKMILKSFRLDAGLVIIEIHEKNIAAWFSSNRFGVASGGKILLHHLAK